MRNNDCGYITPENFGQRFVESGFEAIYEQCSKDFKTLVTLEQFIEVAHAFNHGVESYRQLHHSGH